MNRHVRIPAALWLTAALLLLLAGCTNTGRRVLYRWGSFPDASYAWLKDNAGDDSQVLAAMEKDLQTAIANDRMLPPGFHAHLGLLYLKAGHTDLALSHWEAEKAAFPESATFMEFQLQSLRGAPRTEAEPAAEPEPAPQPAPEPAPEPEPHTADHGIKEPAQ